ncbi:MAG: hypothetical protein U1E76_14870 [Planctomycetota bacterium]
MLDLPPGPPLAVLADRAAPWPRANGLRMRGYRLDRSGCPTFLYGDAGTTIEEHLRSAMRAGGAVLVRSFRIDTRESAELRVAVGKTIEPCGEHTFRIDGRLTVRCELPPGRRALVRAIAGDRELLVPALPAIELSMTW